MAFSLLGNKISGIGDITGYHQHTFGTGYGTFLEEPTYQPQQHRGSDQHRQVKVINIPHRKRRNGSAAPQHEEDIE